MKNVEMDIKGDELTITVDLSREFGRSKSGKTIVIASTEGNVQPPGASDSVRLGLNLYRFPERS